MFSLYSQNGVWMGVAGLSNIDMRKRSAEFGRLMIEKDEVTEKGLGVDIVNGIVNLAIGKMAINKITLEVFSDNIAALKTYERTGFVKTGRTEALHDGRKLIYMERTIEEERK